MRTSFDKTLVQTVRNEVEEAIKTIAEKYGLKASTLGNIGYNDNSNLNCQRQCQRRQYPQWSTAAPTSTVISVVNGSAKRRQ
jgi:hypothetical protein